MEITFLFITHDQEEALSLSDRLGVMCAGRLEQVGAPRELYRQPSSRFVAEFLGDVNWLEGTAVRPEALRISHEQPSRASKYLPGIVQGLTFLGSRVHVRAALRGGADCTVEVDETDAKYAPGDAVHVWWNAADELPLAASAAL